MHFHLTRSVKPFPSNPSLSSDPEIWIQTGAKLSQQLLHPLQTRLVFLELSVGKASAKDGGSPRDLYERHTREEGMGESDWKGKDWEGNGVNGDTPTAWQWGDHSISIALWPLMLITSDRPASSVLFLIKTKSTATRHLQGSVGQRRLSNFGFHKQGESRSMYHCKQSPLMCVCMCLSLSHHLVIGCKWNTSWQSLGVFFFFVYVCLAWFTSARESGAWCVIDYTQKCHYPLRGNQAGLQRSAVLIAKCVNSDSLWWGSGCALRHGRWFSISMPSAALWILHPPSSCLSLQWVFFCWCTVLGV